MVTLSKDMVSNAQHILDGIWDGGKHFFAINLDMIAENWAILKQLEDAGYDVVENELCGYGEIIHMKIDSEGKIFPLVYYSVDSPFHTFDNTSKLLAPPTLTREV